MLFFFISFLAQSEPTIILSADGLELTFEGDGIINQEITRKKGIYTKIQKVYVDGASSLSSNSFESFESMVSISLTDTITEIGANCFKGCTKLQEFTFPNDIETIQSGLFCDCTSLKIVRINAKVSSIDTFTLFMNCQSLTTFNVSLSNQFLSTDDTYSFLLSKNGSILYSAPGIANQVIPSTVKIIRTNCYYAVTLTSIDFSKCQIEEIQSYGCRAIKINSLTFPSTLLRVQSMSFYQATISSLSFPSSLIYFDSEVLSGIIGLTMMKAENSTALTSKNGMIMDYAETVIFLLIQL